MTRSPLLLVASQLAVLAAACGSDARPEAPSQPPPVAPPTVEAAPRDADDLIVARVDGRPVYASCVEAQAEHLGVDVRAALDQCIAFELLAGAADARGLRDDPEVIETWRREMVRTVIRADLSPIARLEDLPEEFLTPLLEARGAYRYRPLMRASYYARVEVPETAAPDGPEDRAARAVADAVYAELGEQPGLLPDELVAATERHAGGLEVSHIATPYLTPERDDMPVQVAVPEYRKALYAIPEIGRISPPVRTRWGWDLILWWDTLPATDFSESFFAAARQNFFQMWAGRIARQLGLKTWIDEALLAGLVEDAP